MKSKYFFWIIFIITLYWILQLYKPFLMNFIIALLLCVATFGLKNKIDKYIKYNLISSFVTLIVFLGICIIPLILVGYEILDQITNINILKLTYFINELKEKSILLTERFPEALRDKTIDFIRTININILVSHMMSISSIVGKAGIKFITDLIFILVFLYLFYYYGVYLKNYIVDIIPFDRKNSNEILSEVSGVLKVVFFTTIISMVLQGLSFGIIASFFGFSGILFGVLYGLASIVPVVGGALVWIPIALYVYWTGDLKSAIFISVYSLIFIGMIIDNVIKPLIIGVANNLLLKNPVQINEMLIFISILAGLASFGFWGIIIGPTMSAFFIALLRMYKDKFKNAG